MLHWLPPRRRTFDVSLFLVIATIVVASIVRIAAIDERTIHIDEGMGIRASGYALQGVWRYYSANGHGPTLFYLGAIEQAFFGNDLAAARSVTVTAGIIGLVLLTYALYKTHKGAGLLVLVSTLGFSSGMVFYSAYFIHEMIFILATIGTFLAADAWARDQKKSAVILTAVGAALMYATKETALLTWFAWAVACGVTLLFNPKQRFLLRKIPWSAVLMGTIAAFIIFAILFTSFFVNAKGLLDSFLSPFHWFDRAQQMHIRPFWYFGGLLMSHEMGLLLTTGTLLVTCLAARVWSPRLTFILTWWIVIFLIYSAIGYKTPWCIPNLILPLGLFSASAAMSAWPKIHDAFKMTLGILLCTWTAFAFIQTLQDGFANPNLESPLSYTYLQSDESLDNFSDILRGLSYMHDQPGVMPVKFVGHGDELLYVLTSPYATDYGEFKPDFPVYVNYQSSADDLAIKLAGTGKKYERAVFTYIQHVNQVDLFIEESLWQRYLQAEFAVLPHVRTEGMYDYRTQ